MAILGGTEDADKLERSARTLEASHRAAEAKLIAAEELRADAEKEKASLLGGMQYLQDMAVKKRHGTGGSSSS